MKYWISLFFLPLFFFSCQSGESKEKSPGIPPPSTPIHHSPAISWTTGFPSAGEIPLTTRPVCVTDSGGNIYWGASMLLPDGNEQPLIGKVWPHGQPSWEYGAGSQGRITDLWMDGKERLWVAGAYTDHLQLGRHRRTAPGETRGFFAEWATSGECQSVVEIPAEGTLTQICANEQGEVLVFGSCKGKVSLGYRTLGESPHTDQFLGLFTDDKVCRQLLRFPKNVRVADLLADEAGNFLLAGSIQGTFSFRDQTVQTNSSHDWDGMVMKLNRKLEILWIHTFDNPGNYPAALPTQEQVCGLQWGADGELLLGLSEMYPDRLVATPSEAKNSRFWLIPIADDGTLLLQREIVSQNTGAGDYALARDKEGTIWVAGHTQHQLITPGTQQEFDHPQTYLLKIEGDASPEVYTFAHGPETYLHALAMEGQKLIMLGTFRDSLALGDTTLRSQNRVALFMSQTAH